MISQLHGGAGIGDNRGSGSLSVVRTINIAWNPLPPTNLKSTNPVGYRIHIGIRSRIYTIVQDVGMKTLAHIAGLIPGHLYFIAITAYNASGIDSLYSNEIRAVAP